VQNRFQWIAVQSLPIFFAPCGQCSDLCWAYWTRTRSAIASLAAVGNSLKICKIFRREN